LAADALVPKLLAITNNNADATLYVRGDQAINYGRVLEVMSLVSQAGFKKVSLIAQMPKSGGGAASAAKAPVAQNTRR
jgi:biopolymer transport protein TolR